MAGARVSFRRARRGGRRGISLKVPCHGRREQAGEIPRFARNDPRKADQVVQCAIPLRPARNEDAPRRGGSFWSGPFFFFLVLKYKHPTFYGGDGGAHANKGNTFSLTWDGVKNL